MSEATEQKSTPIIQTPVVQIGSRMLRSPSHDSVTTDLSLFSVSSTTSNNNNDQIASKHNATNNQQRVINLRNYSDAHLPDRIPSPNPESRLLQIPRNSCSRPVEYSEALWFEEDNDLIRSCAVLSSALGLQKSFSTSDVFQLPSPDGCNGYDLAGRLNGSVFGTNGGPLRSAVSSHGLDLAQRTSFLLEQTRLDHASRSCSTWVAVGDMSSTSQLPSPHGANSSSHHPVPTTPQVMPLLPFTAADLVRSVNKKVRQNYIRRRLMMTYKALERLSQSEFNLDRLEAAASAAKHQNQPTTLPVPDNATSLLADTSSTSLGLRNSKNKDHALTVRDVQRERGKQLSKYERNIMIFNWLHTLDDTVDDQLVPWSLETSQ